MLVYRYMIYIHTHKHTHTHIYIYAGLGGRLISCLGATWATIGGLSLCH